MSVIAWLKRVFVPQPSDNEGDELEEQSFSFTEHMRIVVAMLIVLLSAMVLWWILV